MSRLDGVAAVEGVAAVFLERLMREQMARVRAIPQEAIRIQLLEAFDDLRWAADRWRAVAVVSASGHADTGPADIGAGFAGDEIPPGEAMRLLAITSDRQLRRLAGSQGLGVKVGGRWRLSRDAVLAYCEQKESA